MFNVSSFLNVYSKTRNYSDRSIVIINVKTGNSHKYASAKEALEDGLFNDYLVDRINRYS